jgi:hypothetical protein
LGIENPRGLRFAIDSKSNHDGERTIAFREIARPVERVDDPDGATSGIAAGADVDRLSLLSHHAGARQQREKGFREPGFALPVGDRQHIAGSFLLDLASLKRTKTRHDDIARDLP